MILQKRKVLVQNKEDQAFFIINCNLLTVNICKIKKYYLTKKYSIAKMTFN